MNLYVAVTVFFLTSITVSISGPEPWWRHPIMMTSSNGNIFRVTGHLCGEFTGLRWIPRTKASDAELWCFLWAWINDWVNNCEAGDLRRHHAHYDVTVMHDGEDVDIIVCARFCYVLFCFVLFGLFCSSQGVHTMRFVKFVGVASLVQGHSRGTLYLFHGIFLCMIHVFNEYMHMKKHIT